MAISNKANDALQVRYDELRAQGLSKEDATAQIKGNLKNIGAYDKLKAQNSMGTTTANVAQNAANVASQVAFPTQTNTQPIDNPPPVSNQVYSDGQVTQSAEQIKQNAFDQANPVGTKLETITGPTTEQVAQATEQATFRTNGTPTTTTTTEKITSPNGEITKVTTPTQEVPKDQRSQEILNNLNEGYKNAPNLFTDQETFRNAYDYNTADDNKKRILDAFFNAHQQNESSIFNQLMTGQDITTPSLKNTIDYKKALTRYNDFKNYASYSDKDFSQVIANGELVPGTTIYNDLIKDPNISQKIQKAQSLNQINGVKTDINKATTNTSNDLLKTTNVKVDGNIMSLDKAMADGYISEDEAKTMFSSPEIDSKTAEYNEKQLELDELQSTYENIRKTTIDELKGTGATKTYLEALIAQRQEDILGPLNLLEKQQNTRLGVITQLKQDKKDLFNTNLENYKTQEERLYNETQANRAYDLQYGNPDSEDERVRQTYFRNMAENIQKQYAGIPFVRDINAMAEDFENAYANGQSLDQITQDVVGAIKSKPEYQNWAIKSGLEKDPYETQIRNLELATAQEQLAQLKNKTIETSNPSWKQDTEGNWYDSNSNVRPDIQKTNAVLNSPMANTPNNTVFKENERGYWCGQFVNDSLGTRLFGDKLADKTKHINSTVPVQGGVVVMDMPGKYAENGHVGLVVGFTEDGILMKSSNFSAPGKVTTEEIKYNDPRIKGYYTPTAKNTTQTTTGGATTAGQTTLTKSETGSIFTDSQLGVMSSIDSITPSTLKALEGAGLNTNDWGLFKSGALPPTVSQQASATETIKKIDELLNHSNLEDAVGGISSKLPTISGKTNDFINKFNSFVAGLTKDNLGQLKGPMSDKDIKFITDMSSVLNINSDEENFKQNLKDLQEKYKIIASGQSLNASILGNNQTPTQTTYTKSEQDILNSLKAKLKK